MATLEDFKEEITGAFAKLSEQMAAQKAVMDGIAYALNCMAPEALEQGMKKSYVDEMAKSIKERASQQSKSDFEKRMGIIHKRYKVCLDPPPPVPHDFEFPAKSKEDILNVLGCKRLLRYFLYSLQLSGKSVNEAAAEICTRMVGNFNAMTRKLNFVR